MYRKTSLMFDNAGFLRILVPSGAFKLHNNCGIECQHWRKLASSASVHTEKDYRMIFDFDQTNTVGWMNEIWYKSEEEVLYNF